MLINTAVLGPVEVAAEQVFRMPNGLLGFDGVTQYALITTREDDVTLMWYQAVDSDVPCFVVFDPFQLVEGYQPEVEPSDLRAVGCSDPGELSYLVIAVVPEDVTQTTVNLKSPIIINNRDRIARQVILSNKDYPIRFSLVEEQRD